VRKVKRTQKVERIKERKAQREKELALKKAEKKLKKGTLKPAKKLEEKDEEEWEEVDEHEKDIFDKDGYFDVPDTQAQISHNDEKLLKTLQKRREETGKAQPKQAESINLADLIMQKLQSGQFQDGAALDKKQVRYEDLEDGVASSLDPKVVAAYKSLGTVLRQYKSGKLPKLFKIMPQIANWEEVLFLTKPE
jgi:essential nuclear protein 1